MVKIVSILIPTRNRKILTIKAIRSALAQSYKNIEIIVTDNSDKGELKPLIDDLRDSRIRYFKNSKNIGPILNWRKALEIAEGELCLLLPDDDFIINPFYIEDAVKVFENEAVGLLVTDCILSYPRYNKVCTSGNSGCIAGQDFIRRGLRIPHIGNVFRRRMALDLDAFNSNDILWSDIELWQKIMSNSIVYCYTTPSMLYYFHSDNIVLNMSRGQLIENSRFIRPSVSGFANEKLIGDLLVRYFLMIDNISQFVNVKFMLEVIEVNQASRSGVQIFLKYYFFLLKNKVRSVSLLALNCFKRS